MSCEYHSYACGSTYLNVTKIEIVTYIRINLRGMELGKRIKKLRKKQKGLTQEKLGMKNGETGNKISLIERGKRLPSFDVAV